MSARMPNPNDVHEQRALAAAILRREPAEGELAGLRDAISGRSILITGAGGHIGAGLSTLVAELGASRLTLVDNGEHGLYSIDAELAERHPDLPRATYYCDIRDSAAVTHCLSEARPELVVHAAALKQLPLLERHVREAFLTNTLGALNVATAAASAGAAAVILISTDKAAHPSSALGATKRMAERLYQELDRTSAATRFVSVRFGNVFASRGSVVPLFRRQIAAGGPLTLTDPAMKRYFITLEEACRLTLSGLLLTAAPGSERGDLYVLEGDKPLSIQDLAQRLIVHDGGGKEIPILTVGVRDGERLSESLIRSDEISLPTALPGIVRVRSSIESLPLLRQAVLEMGEIAAACDEGRLCEAIGHLVPEFAGAAAIQAGAAALRA